MSIWNLYIKNFEGYLKIEKSLSPNSIDAYLHDVELLMNYLRIENKTNDPNEIKLNDLENFIAYLHDLDLSDRSQARIISGLKAFYKFLMLEAFIKEDPTVLLEGPKLSKKLPDTLSFDEIEQLIGALDLSKDENVRNKAVAYVFPN